MKAVVPSFPPNPWKYGKTAMNTKPTISPRAGIEYFLRKGLNELIPAKDAANATCANNAIPGKKM